MHLHVIDLWGCAVAREAGADAAAHGDRSRVATAPAPALGPGAAASDSSPSPSSPLLSEDARTAQRWRALVVAGLLEKAAPK